MAYEPKTWVNGEKITAEDMNHLEQGVANEQVGPEGPQGVPGRDGRDGRDGEGVPPGGTTGQMLMKASDADFDTQWADPPEGGGGVTGTVPITRGGTGATTAPAALENLGAAPTESPVFTGSISLGRMAETTVGSLSFAVGNSPTASGPYSHAGGINTTASGHYSHAEGEGTMAEYTAQTAIGRYNVKKSPSSSSTVGDYFVVGKGTSTTTTARANAFRVDGTGCYGTGAWNASGADYAELFEWLDGNPDQEDRCGRFVTPDGEKIRLAGPEDDFILGIVSGNPSVVGDVHDDQWQGMYLYDVFGRPLWEDVEVPAETDPEGRVIIPAHTEHRQKLNPDYDSTQPYQPRTQRPEWDAVGMLGKLVAADDGTCQVNGWCTVGEGGIATHSAERTKYRVLSRLDERHVKVLVM